MMTHRVSSQNTASVFLLIMIADTVVPAAVRNVIFVRQRVLTSTAPSSLSVPIKTDAGDEHMGWTD